VVSVCNHYKLPKPLNVHYGGPKEATSPKYLAGSLARALYAIRTDNFFVHEGVTARYLEKFILAYTCYPVIAVDEDNVAGHESRLISGVVPRIFVAIPDSPNVLQDAEYNDWFYGRAVEYDELNEALESLTTYWKAERPAAMREEHESRVTTHFS
jgi:hypothetical protein